MSTDQLLSQTDQMEALSFAYLRAIAARAGYATSVPDYDRGGIDVYIHARGRMSKTLNVQLKATADLKSTGNGTYVFSLSRNYYDSLRGATGSPGILVVLDMPSDKTLWLSVSCEGLLLRRRAYWLDLGGLPESSNAASVSVSIPEDNVFEVESLRQLMQEAQRGYI